MSTALEKAIEAAGGARKLAKAIGVTSMTISHWKTRGVPAERAVQVENAVHGKVTRYQLRPDLFGKADRFKQEARA